MSKRYGLFAAAVLALCAGAQETQTTNVKGRLHGEAARTLHGYVIELEHVANHRGQQLRVDVESDGEFSFRGIAYGEYLLKVTTYQDQVISQQFVSVREGMGPLEVRLRPQPASPTGGTVSVGELRHPPARKAVDATMAAQRFAEAGHYDRAAGELEKALRISPNFAVAHSNLGVQYIRMRRFEEALTEIEHALEIAGPNARDLVNLAFALTGLERIPDAVEAAKGALRIDRNDAGGHYILGSLLALNRETRGEGIAHLEVAAKTLESARKALARMAGPAE